MPKNAVPSYESKFFIDEYGLSGIRDWEASYSVPQQTIMRWKRVLCVAFIVALCREIFP